MSLVLQLPVAWLLILRTGVPLNRSIHGLCQSSSSAHLEKVIFCQEQLATLAVTLGQVLVHVVPQSLLDLLASLIFAEGAQGFSLTENKKIIGY